MHNQTAIRKSKTFCRKNIDFAGKRFIAMSILKVKKLNKNAKVPFRATKGSAGMDLYACIDVPIIIAPHTIKVIPTGLAIELESANYVAYIFARSGLAIGLVNQTDNAFTILPEQRIAQLVISPVIIPEIELVDELDDTERGSGGFGSTGKE